MYYGLMRETIGDEGFPDKITGRRISLGSSSRELFKKALTSGSGGGGSGEAVSQDKIMLYGYIGLGVIGLIALVIILSFTKRTKKSKPEIREISKKELK